MTADDLRGLPLERLLATVQELAAKLLPGATSAPPAPSEPEPIEQAGPGVTKVLELLRTENPAA
jgi:hypothetical protein